MPGEEYLVALGHIQGDHGPPSEHVYAAAASPPPGDANQAASGGGSNTNTAKRRSLWSGFKQIFRGRHSASSIHSSGYGSVDRSGGKHRREPPQSLSYSCLGGNGRSRQMADEEDIYRDINSFILRSQHLGDLYSKGHGRTVDGEMNGEGLQQRLSRNLSLSHESVFQMEPHNGQHEDPGQVQPKMIYHRTYSSTHHLPASCRPTSYIQSPPTAVPPRLPAMALQSELAMVLRERHYRGEGDIFSSNRGDGEKGKRSLDLTDDEDLGLPKSLQNSPGDFSDEGGRGKSWRGSRDHSWNRNLSTGSGENSWSRHHSSCSDNSLLSLDSFESRLDRDKSPPRGDGKLSHKAALHKMAVRPRKNHAAARPGRPRRMTQVTEESTQADNNDASKDDIIENDDNKKVVKNDSEKERREAKTKSLDSLFRGQPAPGPELLAAMANQQQEQTRKSQQDSEPGFLSRLFGSKRSKSRTPRESVEKSPRALPKQHHHDEPPPQPAHVQPPAGHIQQSGGHTQQLSGHAGSHFQHPAPANHMSYTSQQQPQVKPDYGMHFQPIGLPLPENVHSKVPQIYAPSPEEQEVVKNAVVPQPKISPSNSKTSTKGRAPPPPPAYSPPSYKKGSGTSPVDLQVHKSRTLTNNKSNKNQSSTKSTSNITSGGGVTKSHSFRSMDSSAENIDYPSLPVQVPYNDIILKKNKSLSSVLDSEDAKNSSRMKFHSSIQNWSHANEGLKRSISSLAPPLTIDNLVIPNSHSNESLKTITSLLEEPDILVQTRVGERNQDSKKPKTNPSNQTLEDKSATTNAHPVNSFYDVIFTKEFGQLAEKPDFSKLIRNPLDLVQQDSSMEIVQDSSIDSFHEAGGTDRSLTEACVVSDSNTYHYKDNTKDDTQTDDTQTDDKNEVIEDNDNNLSEDINDINEELCLARVPSSFEDNDSDSDKSDSSQEDEKLSLDAHEQEIDANQEEMGGVVAGQLDINQPEEISAVAAQPIMDEEMHIPPVKAKITTPTPPDSLTTTQQHQYKVQNNCPSVVTYGALIPPPPLEEEVHNSAPLHQKQEKSDAVKKQTSFTERDDNTHTIHAKHFNKQNNEPQNIAEIKEQDFNKDNEEKTFVNKNNTIEKGEEIVEVENGEENAGECLNSGKISGTTLIAHTPVIGATPCHASGLEHLKDQTQQQHQHSLQQQKHESEKTTMDKLAQKSNHETKLLNEDFKHVDVNICSEANAKDVVEALATIVDKIDVSIENDNRAKVLNGDVIENTKISQEFKLGSADIIDPKEEVETEKVNENISPIDASGKDDAKVKVENEINNPIIEDKHEAATTTPNHDSKTENVSSKPAVSLKPVPAPRHFFLKPLNDEPAPNSELENVFARRSRSIRNLREVKDLDNNDVKADSNFSRSKSARNLGDIHRPATGAPDLHVGEPAAANINNMTDQLLNVKERAKSFTTNITPQPFRPKPTNIPPKPKLPVKPVPAPRTFRSVSSANLGPTIRRPNLEVKPGSKSASNILTNTSRISSDHQNETLSTENEKLDNNLQSPDILSDIQVKKIRQNFLSGDQTKPTNIDNIPTQQSNDNNISNRVLKSTDSNTSPVNENRTSPVAVDKPSLPEKPSRRIRELSMERQLSTNGAEDNFVNKPNNNEENEEENENINTENSGAATNGKKKKNVMSIVSRINAMAL